MYFGWHVNSNICPYVCSGCVGVRWINNTYSWKVAHSSNIISILRLYSYFISNHRTTCQTLNTEYDMHSTQKNGTLDSPYQVILHALTHTPELINSDRDVGRDVPLITIRSSGFWAIMVLHWLSAIVLLNLTWHRIESCHVPWAINHYEITIHIYIVV